MKKKHHYPVHLLVSIGLLCSGIAVAAELDLGKADALLKAGKAKEGYTLLAPHEHEMAGNVDYDYLLGIAALDSGNPEKASLALERVLAANPDYAGARLDLARAHFALGDLARAKTEFEAVQAQNPPPAAKTVIEQYLTKIDKKTSLSNIATTSQSSTPAFGANPAATKQRPRKAIKAPAVRTKKMSARANNKKRKMPVIAELQAVQPVLAPTPPSSEVAEVPPQKFTVKRYSVQGNTLLATAEVERIVGAFVGENKDFGDIQRALEALENAYHSKGYSTVQIYLPEQELDKGIITLQVTESVIGKVTVAGNQHFDTQNIRASLPALKEGTSPNTRAISESVQLANENPAKQVEIVLGLSKEEGKVDAKVNVVDEKPLKVFATLDNSGTDATGIHRLGIAMQHANLFDRDHTLSLAYATSPDKPNGVDVSIYSLGYRIPFYDIGDSMDFIYGSSTIGVPSSTAALGSTLGIVGQGDIYGLRWNHYFMRQGEYSHKLILGLDQRAMKSTCTTEGGSRLTGVAGCEDYTTRPVSITYTGLWSHPGEVTEFSMSLARNWTGGSGGSAENYRLAASDRSAKTEFTVLRLSGSYTKALPQDWQIRLAFNGQYADTALTPAEQISLAGATSVRGFAERAAAADNGLITNIELYSPELAPYLGLSSGNLRALVFHDWSGGNNYLDAGSDMLWRNPVMSSAGIGLRFNIKKDVALRIDYARTLDHSPALPPTEPFGKWHGHANLVIGF